MKHDKENIHLKEKTIIEFYQLLQSAKIHDFNNNVVINCTKNLLGSLNQWWIEDDSLTIKLSRGRLLVQDYKIRYSQNNKKIIKGLYNFFENRQIQGICFKSELKKYSLENLFDFARILHLAKEKDEPVKFIFETLRDKTFSWVSILENPMAKSQKQDLERKQMVRKTYTYALTSVKDVAHKINNNQKVGVRKLKRIAQNMVDILSEDESVLLGISTIRDYDDYTYTHSVNVAILSLCLGKRIGLSRVSLSHLAICGLVHDLGKIDIPKRILNKRGKLTDDEFKVMQTHPQKSLHQILKLQAPLDLKTKILLPPFEHHLKYDLSGYPKMPNKKSISLFGRILAIADVFDALTSPRIYRPEACSPDFALDHMLKKSGKDFDPVLLKVFINMLGVYPVGTLLKLDTGEIGLVTSCTKNGNPDRPYVTLLMQNGNGKFRKGSTVDLNETNPKTGLYERNILRSCHPSNFGIQPANYIL